MDMPLTRTIVITSCFLLVMNPCEADLKQSSSTPASANSVRNLADRGFVNFVQDRFKTTINGSHPVSDVNGRKLQYGIDLDNLEYIGCYDVWEQKRRVHEDILSDNILAKCAYFCNYAGLPDLVGIRGDACFCPRPDAFTLVRVKDHYCHIDCSLTDSTLEPGNKTCGGHYSLSLYCPKDSGKCQDFYEVPITDLYEETTVPVPTNDFLKVQAPRCANCSWCFATLKPEFDYIPNNSPELCAQYCRRLITYYKDNVTTRNPTLYALAGWVNKSITVPSCGCTNTTGERLYDVSSEFCDSKCSNTEQCGSRNFQYMVNIYETGIDWKPPPPPTTTTTQSTTTTTLSPPDTSTSTTTTGPDCNVSRCPELPPPPSECHGKKQCQKKDPYNDKFIWIACAEETRVELCPNGASGTASWKCLASGEFEGETPKYAKCSTVWIKEVEHQLEEAPAGSALPILEKVEEYCTKAIHLENTEAQYFGHEISQILYLAVGILKDLHLTDGTDLLGFERMTKLMTMIGDSVMTNPRTWKQLVGMNLSCTVSCLLRTLDESSFELADKAEVLENYEEYRKAFHTELISLETGVTVLDDNTDNVALNFNSDGSFIELPLGWETALKLTTSNPERLTTQFSGMAILTQKANPFPSTISGMASDSKDFNGKIMSFSLTRPTANTTVTFSGTGVTIGIVHDVLAWGNGVERNVIRRKLHSGENPKAIMGSAVCVFWDMDLGLWSQNGCKLVESTAGFTHCECSHLTSFAVLFSYYDYVEKSLALEILTLVLCSLSIVSLLATIVIFTKVKATHGTRTTITKNLAFCLIIGNALVVLVVDRNYFNMSEGFCIGAGIVTHYAFLCAFMWMAVEGFHLYKMMIHVFDSGQSHLTQIRIVAFGFPLFIIILTGVIGLVRHEQPYGGEEFCWLNGAYSLAFIVPVGLIIFGNLIVVLITLRVAYNVHGSPSQMTDRRRPSYKTWIRGSFSITILLGITWTVGYIQMFGSLTSEVAAYFFTILNASQGFFIFIYHCLMNEKVRKAAERRKIPFPAWLNTDSSTNTRTTSGRSASNMRNSRLGRQHNIHTLYSDSARSRKTVLSDNVFTAGGPLESFSRNHNTLNHATVKFISRSSNTLNSLILNSAQEDSSGTVSSNSSSTITPIGGDGDTTSSQSDLLKQFRNHQ